MGWALVADTIPLYPRYALLFARHGLSAAPISAVFAVGSMVGLVAEVPAGALADRWSRRGTLVLGALLQAAEFAGWTARPGVALVALAVAGLLPVLLRGQHSTTD